MRKRYSPETGFLSKTRFLLGLVVWLAFWLRVRGLFANTFHADEALFATWARYIAVWKDPLLLTQAVDKPPLLFYLQALFYPLQGPVEWAARMPNFIASILLVPLTAVLTHHLYHNKTTALVSAFVLACSPLAIQFSATAFTDPLLTFWLIASLSVIRDPYSVFRSRITEHGLRITDYRLPFTSGLLFGLAAATKYQAWLFLPLVGGVGWLMGYGRRQWAYWLMGLLPVLTAVLLWEVARTGIFSLWSAQMSNFGGVRLAWLWELWPRLAAWARLWSTAVPIILLPVLLLFVAGLVWWAEGENRQIDLLLVLFVIGYWVLHWLTAVPVWDRYLLPLVPIIAILIGRGVTILRYWDIRIFNTPISQYPNIRFLLFGLVLIFLLFPAWNARYGRYPIGGRPDADQGAAQIATYLQDAPYGTVLYDHWFSWHWRYHFFDKRVYVSWFPNGDALAEQLTVFGGDENARYVALPDTAVSQPIHRASQNAGFQLHPVAHADNITLYRIEQVNR